MKSNKNREKSFDSTITNLLRKLEKEFRSAEDPLFILLIHPTTQNFHYYGKKYFSTKINKRIETGELQFDALKKAVGVMDKTIKKDPNLIDYYKNYGYSIIDIDKTHKRRFYIKKFVDLLVSTPCSRHYGMSGRIYHTRIPVFCYNNTQVLKSGILQFIESDALLGNQQDNFTDIINTCEKVLWGEKYEKIKSNIMVPIYLWGQVMGNAFITNDKQFNYYNYLRFLQIIKEFTTTSLKDAKRYEFLTKVIQSLPNKNFNVVITIFENLPFQFNISGACLRYKGNCYHLAFTSINSEMTPDWHRQACPCELSEITDEKKFEVLTSEEICHKLKKKHHFLGIKSGLKFIKGDAEFILYFNFPSELLDINGEQLRLEIEEAFELTELAERNLEFYKAYGHDTDRFIFSFSISDNQRKLVDNRTKLMTILAGGKFDTSPIYLNELKGRIRYLYKFLKKVEQSNDPALRCPRLYISIENHTYNVNWPAIENILNNLFKNTLKYKIDKGSRQKILCKIFESNNFLILQYSQSGDNLKFEATAEDLQQWLQGHYDFNTSRGFGHYIIQITMNRFNGKLEIILEKDIDLSITKEKIINLLTEKIRTDEEKITYKMYFPKNCKDV